jgi:glycosyltransferase involved in cell wall biosynthesis
MSPLLSIIIPTRNRYEYLYFCLLSLLENYNNLNVEIILHDNSTDIMPINVAEIIKSNAIIKYYQIEGWISACENIERAIDMSTGQYITMIGDDDSLSKYILDAVDYMKANNVDALNSPFAHYIWPDIQSRVFKKSFSGKMEILKFDGKIREITVENQIEKLLNKGGTSLVELPRMYYGIVRRDIIEKVKNISGNYIPGPSPDMANAVSMAMFTKKNHYVNLPLFIAGNSSKSTAGMGAKGEHIGKIEDISFLPKDCAQNWSSLVPKYWSGPTIWAESTIKALEKSGGKEFLLRFNYIRLYANCLVFNPLWKKATWTTFNDYIKVFNCNRYFALIQLYLYVFLIWIVRFKILVKNILKIINNRIFKRNGIYSIDNVYLATEKLNNKLDIISKSSLLFMKK